MRSQSLLVHDRVDLDVREIADGSRFQRRHDRLRHLAALLPQLEVIDQAVLERRVGVFDRSRRVDAVDSPHKRHRDTHGCKHARAVMPVASTSTPQKERKPEDVVEDDLEEEDGQESDQQRQAGGDDIGDLDPPSGALDLVVDELLVIE